MTLELIICILADFCQASGTADRQKRRSPTCQKGVGRPQVHTRRPRIPRPGGYGKPPCAPRSGYSGTSLASSLPLPHGFVIRRQDRRRITNPPRAYRIERRRRAQFLLFPKGHRRADIPPPSSGIEVLRMTVPFLHKRCHGLASISSWARCVRVAGVRALRAVNCSIVLPAGSPLSSVCFA